MSLMLFFHLTHHLIIIFLCASGAVSRTSVPRTDGLLHVVGWVGMGLDEEKHLLRLVHTETVAQGVTLAAAALAQNPIALFHHDGCNLHCSARIAADGFGIAFALDLYDGLDDRGPVERR